MIPRRTSCLEIQQTECLLLCSMLLKPARGGALSSSLRNFLEKDCVCPSIRKDVAGEGSVSLENLRQTFPFHCLSSFCLDFTSYPGNCLCCHDGRALLKPHLSNLQEGSLLLLFLSFTCYNYKIPASHSGVKLKRKEKGPLYLKLVMCWSPSHVLKLLQ